MDYHSLSPTPTYNTSIQKEGDAFTWRAPHVKKVEASDYDGASKVVMANAAIMENNQNIPNTDSYEP